MGIRDLQLELASSQVVTASAVGENVIDLKVANPIGVGEPMAVVFNVEVAADQTTGDEDYTFDIEVATDAAQTTGRQILGRRIFESGNPTAPAQNADLLVAGFQFVIPVPPTSVGEAARYFGIRCITAGTSPTITVSAYLVPQSFIEQANLTAWAVSIL